jgi:hypothetical protein
MIPQLQISEIILQYELTHLVNFSYISELETIC